MQVNRTFTIGSLNIKVNCLVFILEHTNDRDSMSLDSYGKS